MDENNKRIAKNTVYLYLRMLVIMLIGLYTSRVVLNALGVEDYGLYNVVGGFVGMLTFFNNLLSGGSSRFITFYLGLGDEARLKQVFSACVSIHLLMGILIVIFGETVGLWFVNEKLNLDPSRMVAANWVYQFSLLSTFLSVAQTPYSSAVIAHEKMSAFAYMTIFDVVAKLLLVFLLLTISFDRLIFYAFFYFLVNFVSVCIYRFYCHRNFSECGLKLGYDAKLYKELFTYTGWNVIGAIAHMANNQGMNVLLNIFFGTVVNASRGIAMNVAGIVGQFVSNFQSSASPQIIKYYSAGNIEQMNKLISNASKYATYIFLVIAIPVFIEAEELLRLWLGIIPQYSVWFVRLTIIQTLVVSIDIPVGRGIQAYGRMKLPNLTSALVYMSVLPISYVSVKLGATVYVVYWITIAAYPGALLFDLWILHKYSGFNGWFFIKDVVLRCLSYCLLIGICPTIIHLYMHASLVRIILVCVSSGVLSLVVIFFLGIPKHLRKNVINQIKIRLGYA